MSTIFGQLSTTQAVLSSVKLNAFICTQNRYRARVLLLSLAKGENRVHQEDDPVDDGYRALCDGQVAGSRPEGVLPGFYDENTRREEQGTSQQAVEQIQTPVDMCFHQVA